MALKKPVSFKDLKQNSHPAHFGDRQMPLSLSVNSKIVNIQESCRFFSSDNRKLPERFWMFNFVLWKNICTFLGVCEENNNFVQNYILSVLKIDERAMISKFTKKFTINIYVQFLYPLVESSINFDILSVSGVCFNSVSLRSQ